MANDSNPSSSSFPFPPPIDSQWKQVKEFPPQSEPESSDDVEEQWTEQVEYLTFDFGHHLAPDPITSYSNFQVLGLNTDTPFVKIGNQIYRGTYESLVGTELIMNRSTEEDTSGIEQQSQAVFEPLTATASRIKWVPVKLTEKDDQPSSNESSSPEDINGKDTKLKKKAAGGGGGRHWASHWTQFTPRARRSSKKKTADAPEQNEQS